MEPSETLAALAALLTRSDREEASLAAPLVIRARLAFFGTACALCFVPLFIGVQRTARRFTELSAAVPVSHEDWRLLYRAPAEGCGARAGPSCPASPSLPKLWESPRTRQDKLAHLAELKKSPLEPYWLGLELSGDRLRTAAAAGANVLILGSLRCDHRVWIDGGEVENGSWSTNDPLALAIPMGRLGEARPLKVAAWCKPQPGVGIVMEDVPDYLESAPIAGLATPAAAVYWRWHQYFWTMARPLAFLALNVVLAFIFFMLWWIAPEKTEYFYIALFAMSFALVQMRMLNLFHLAVPRRWVTTIGMVMSVLHAVAALLMGFSFARLRRELLLLPVAGWMLACAAAPWLTMNAQQEWSQWAATRLSDACLILGALACFLQAAYLRLSRGDQPLLVSRIRRLTLFGAALASLVAFNHFNIYAERPSVAQMLFGRSGPFFLVLFLGGIALSEYRSEHHLAAAMPVSKFHRMEPLPEAIDGILLNVDLKGSENISRLAAQMGRAGDLLETCLSHLWTAVSKHGGMVLQTEGDGLRALFPACDVQDPARAAFAAVVEIQHSLAELEKRYRAQGVQAAMPAVGLRFRASAVEGVIRPLWQDYGGTRLAGWVEAGSANAFVEGSRLLELERQVAKELGGSRSILIVPPLVRAALKDEQGAGRWLFDRKSFEGKHGRTYEAAAFAIGCDESL